MNDHYLYQVIKAMGKTEVDALYDELKLLKSGKSKLLFKMLRQADKDIAKADIHTKLFRTKYTAEKDYLLRNEFRLLKKIIEKYILAKEVESELATNEELRNRLLAQAMSRYQLPQIAVSYYETAREGALFNLHFDTALEMNMGLVSLKYQHTMKPEEMVKMVMENVARNKQLLQETAVYRASQIQFQLSLAQRIAGATGHKLDTAPTTAAKLIGDLAMHDTVASGFYSQKAKAYNTYSIPDLEAMVEKAEHLPQNPLIRNERITAVVQLASICSMQGHFEKADGLFKKVYESEDLKLLKEKSSFYVNYVRNLTKLKSYKEALKVIEEAQPLLIDGPLKSFLETARITCYLFAKDTQKLKEYLPNDFSDVPEGIQSYYKLLYAIYFYLDGQLPMALRELDNLLSTKDIKKLEGHQELAQTMRNIFRMVEKDGAGKPSKTILKKTATLLQEEKLKLTIEVQTMLPFLWMEEIFGG